MICRHYNLFRVLTLLYMAGVAYLCFATPDMLPKGTSWNFPIPADKIVHFCMFAPLPALLFLSSSNREVKTLLKILATFVIGVILAGLTEIIQGFSPYRSMELGDFIADCLGMALSCLLLLILRKKIS